MPCANLEIDHWDATFWTSGTHAKPLQLCSSCRSGILKIKDLLKRTRHAVTWHFWLGKTQGSWGWLCVCVGEVVVRGYLAIPLETGESGGQGESLFSGESLSLAFALPGLSVGLPGGLVPRAFVAAPWLTCARVGLVGAPRMSWKGTVARMGCRRQPLLYEPGEPALLRLTRGCWSVLFGVDILQKLARGFL